MFYYTFNFVVEEDNESSNQGNGWKINEFENNNGFYKRMKRKWKVQLNGYKKVCTFSSNTLKYFGIRFYYNLKKNEYLGPQHLSNESLNILTSTIWVNLCM